MTKCADPRGDSKSVVLDRHPLVLEYDSQGTDHPRGGIYRLVTIIKGYAFYDAVQNEGDAGDPGHTYGTESVKEALQALRNAKPCKCERCLS